jgi:hypothetical protein
MTGRLIRLRKFALTTSLLLLAFATARPCGPFFTSATFVTHHPESRLALMSGRLGIVWPSFSRPSTLALVFRRLNGPAFSPAELESIRRADAPRTASDRNEQTTAPSRGMNDWVRVSSAAGGTGTAWTTETPVPGSPGGWESYSNCLDDAFENAAQSLKELQRLHPADKADVAEWLTTQDLVFSNCPGVGGMPAALPPSKPLWLRQGRAYQIAAAHFYRAEWTEARSGFEGIAGDRSSPYCDLASYLIARTWIREATLTAGEGKSLDEAKMRAAQAQLKTILAAGGRYAGPAGDLLNLVELRVDPAAAIRRLSDAMAHPDARLAQHAVDFDYAFNQVNNGASGVSTNELAEWVRATELPGSEPLAASTLERWRSSHSVAWMLAALMNARSAPPDLLAAAAAVPRSSPVWTAITYYRLSASPDAAVARAELAQLLPTIEGSETGSDANAFRQLAQVKANSLDEFVRLGTMKPAGYDDGIGDPVLPGSGGPKMPTMAGLPVNADERFDELTARVLNRNVPLAQLAAYARENQLPRQIHFELAMAVWSRAVLLDQPEIARTLTPALIEGEPGSRQWLEAYDAAATPDDRQLAKLLALMRFPSVRPYVEEGAGREQGFVGYSLYRDNWWCAAMDQDRTSPAPAKPLPPSLTPAMLADAQQQRAALLALGDAPLYFGRETLAWVKAHAGDPRGAQLLAFAFRAMHNGCNLEAADGQRREIFDLLHTRYPQSEWAKHYAVFESDSSQ